MSQNPGLGNLVAPRTPEKQGEVVLGNRLFFMGNIALSFVNYCISFCELLRLFLRPLLLRPQYPFLDQLFDIVANTDSSALELKKPIRTITEKTPQKHFIHKNSGGIHFQLTTFFSCNPLRVKNHTWKIRFLYVIRGFGHYMAKNLGETFWCHYIKIYVVRSWPLH